MEEVCERENLLEVLRRVKGNKGSAEIDGMTVGQLSGYQKEHWLTIREQLLNGTYKPQAAAKNRRACQSRADAGMLLHTCLVPAMPGKVLTHAIATTISDDLCGSYCGNARHFRGPGT
jgi:RNA-directed DNA polymerase